MVLLISIFSIQVYHTSIDPLKVCNHFSIYRAKISLIKLKIFHYLFYHKMLPSNHDLQKGLYFSMLAFSLMNFIHHSIHIIMNSLMLNSRIIKQDFEHFTIIISFNLFHYHFIQCFHINSSYIILYVHKKLIPFHMSSIIE